MSFFVRFDQGRAVESASGWNPGEGWFPVDPVLVPVWHHLQLVDGVPLAVPPTVEQVLAERVAAARAAAIQRTKAFANSIRERVASSQHYLQAARWPIQLASAQAIKLGTPSDFDTAIMGREARLRGLGETIEQLADKVLANSLIFASVGAAVDGIERATQDAITAYTGTDPGHFDTILTAAKGTALAEFLDIFGGVYGLPQAQAMAAQFFGPVEAS